MLSFVVIFHRLCSRRIPTEIKPKKCGGGRHLTLCSPGVAGSRHSAASFATMGDEEMGIVRRSGNRLSQADPRRAQERTGLRNEARPAAPSPIHFALLATIFPQPAQRMVKAEPLRACTAAESLWRYPGQSQVNEVYAVASRRMARPAAAM